MLSLTDDQKAEVLRDAYQKHAAELRAIEDGQSTLTGVLLGIFGAGASFLAGTTKSIPHDAKTGLTVVVLAIIGVGTIMTLFRKSARRATRHLLLRCETALGFEETGFYIAGEKLYGDVFEKYATKGWWLDLAMVLVAMSGFGFLLLLWNLS